MSRIGKKPISIPSGVTVTVTGDLVFVKGPKGELSRLIHPDIAVVLEDGILTFSIRRESKGGGALWGLSRALIANMVQGVTEGFQKKLEIEGIGYRANADGRGISLQLGFSHPVRFDPPETVGLSIERNVITVTGADKELVGETAARIRSLKKPEPYKGKGIHYQGEVVRRKAGKRAGAGA